MLFESWYTYIEYQYIRARGRAVIKHKEREGGVEQSVNEKYRNASVSASQLHPTEQVVSTIT